MPTSSVQIDVGAPSNDDDSQQPQQQLQAPQQMLQEPAQLLQEPAQLLQEPAQLLPPQQQQLEQPEPPAEQSKQQLQLEPATGSDRASFASSDAQNDWHQLFSTPSAAGSSADQKDLHGIAHKTNLTILQVKLIFVVALPILGLIGIASKAIDTAASQYHTARRGAETLEVVIQLNRVIRNLQLERGVAATFLLSNGTELESWSLLADYRNLVDDSLAELSPWPSHMFIDDVTFPSPESLRGYLVRLRSEVNDLKLSFSEGIDRYSNLTNGLMTVSQSSLVVPDQGGIWPMAIAFHSLLRCIDVIGVEWAIGVKCLYTCNVSLDTFFNFRRIEGQADSLLTLAFVYQSNYESKYADQFTGSGLEAAIEENKRYIMSPEFKETCLNLSAEERVNATTQWKLHMRMHEVLLEHYEMAMENDTVTTISQVISFTESQLTAYVVVMITVTCICLVLDVWYARRMHRMVLKMTKFSAKIHLKSVELVAEKKRADALLHEMMPREVADQLKMNKEVKAEHYEQCTVYFSDIVGFTTISARSSPLEVVSMLNSLYSLFDGWIDRFQVYKVETIGDCYMVASGVPYIIPDHADEMAKLALELRNSVEDFKIPHLQEALHLRVGLHSGPVVAGVVGVKMPRYCLFGDTVNTANRMESNSEAGKIHISLATKLALDENDAFDTEDRGIITIKGKGEMRTYWLLGLKADNVDKSTTKKTITFLR